MIDKRIRMDCPFCGEKKENIQIISLGSNTSACILRCPKCMVELIGESKSDVINRWNTRV